MLGATLAASGLLVAGCLSLPDRPEGNGPDGDGGPGADAGYARDSGFLLRRHAAVGDLDGDGPDDLALWGNLGDDASQQGQRPAIRLYFGGPTGFEQAPDIDMRFDTDRPWYEVLDVAIEPDESIVFLTAEDLSPRTSEPPHVRRVRAGHIPVLGRAIGEPVFRSQDDLVVSGYVDAPAPEFVLWRKKAIAETTRLVFGFVDMDAIRLPEVGSSNQLTEAPSTFFFWDEPNPVLQDAFAVDNDTDGDDMIVVTREDVGRTLGDAGAGQDIAQTPLGRDCERVARGNLEYGTFFGVATCAGTPDLDLFVLPPASIAPPAVYSFSLESGHAATDLDILDIAGDPMQPELVAIEAGQLVIYGDLNFDPIRTAWTDSRPIGDYDLVVGGHFREMSEHHIYLFSTTDPTMLPLCLEVDETLQLVPCP